MTGGSSDYGELTLDTMMLINGVEAIDTLRIDVEGAEIEAGVLAQWLKCGVFDRVTNLLIEFHVAPAAFNREDLMSHYVEVIGYVRDAGFVMYHAEHNDWDRSYEPMYNGCAGPLYRVYETAWINQRRVQALGLERREE